MTHTEMSMKKTPKKNERRCCPICASEDIGRHVTKETITDRAGKKYVLDRYEYSTCASCETEFVSADQARSNERQFADAKRVEQGSLSGERIAMIRKRLNLRQEDASKIFGGGQNAFSKYEQGYVTQSVAMDRLLRLAEKFPDIVVPFLSELAGTGSGAKSSKTVHSFGQSPKSNLPMNIWRISSDFCVLQAANSSWDSEPSSKPRVQRHLRSFEEDYSKRAVAISGQ